LFGGTRMFRSIAVGVVGLAVLASGAFAQTRVSATEKGSLLVYPKVEVRWNAQGYLLQDTFITLNNDFNADVSVQLYFVNENCTNVDNVITLTHNQPVYWAASSGDPLGVSPWTVLGDPMPDPEGSGDMILRGYVLAWAVNAAGAEIRWNHLFGGATIVNYLLTTAWEYNAYTFQVVDPTVANGDQSGTPGVLNLNGSEYAWGFQYLLLDFFASGSLAFTGDRRIVSNDTDLTLMILSNDLRQETTGPFTTKAVFQIWNGDEVGFSGMEFCFTKFNEELLSHRGGHFLVANLQTAKGRARINGVKSDTVCGVDAHSNAFSLLGVQTKILTFIGDGLALTGGNLFGSGTMAATIQYDVPIPPPETRRGPSRIATPTMNLSNVIATY
jgi:hypothetical protein